MSTIVPQNNNDQEIDLTLISKKISGLMQRINASVFRAIQFFIRNWKIIFALLIIGFAAGLLLDKTRKKYEHEIIVTPNFNSTDYLYSKIDLINAKIRENDTLFLKNIVGIKNPDDLKNIKIEPIVDVYNFIKSKPENFELIKLMAEDGDIKKVLTDNMTSKNYVYQNIVVLTNKKASEEQLVQPLLKYFNSSDYYSKLQKEIYSNVILKMRQNDSIIKQIDGVLNNFSSSNSSVHRNDKLMYYNENTQLNDIIKTKEFLITEQGAHRVELIGFEKIIKENSIILNKEALTVGGYLKFILPLLLILGFVFVHFFIAFYKKQASISGV